MSPEPTFIDLTANAPRTHRRVGLRSFEGGRGRLVIEGDDDFVGAVEIAVRTLALESDAFSRIVEAMQPEDLASAGTTVQAQLNAQAQMEPAEEFGLLSATEVARRVGSQARNTSSLATRWRIQGSIFAVAVRHTQRYPAFQFDDHGRPLPIIGEVMAAAGPFAGWGLALWFT
ncbi:MAG: hypothetical protein ACYDH5_16720, partial [Acidimicrobiales bacterium]